LFQHTNLSVRRSLLQRPNFRPRFDLGNLSSQESETDDDFFTSINNESPDFKSRTRLTVPRLQTGAGGRTRGNDTTSLVVPVLDEKENSFNLTTRRGLFKLGHISMSLDTPTPTKASDEVKVRQHGGFIAASPSDIFISHDAKLRKHTSCDYPSRTQAPHCSKFLVKAQTSASLGSADDIDDSLTGDFTRSFCLPLIHNNKHPDLKSISHDTVCEDILLSVLHLPDCNNIIIIS